MDLMKTDLTMHIDENLDAEGLAGLCSDLDHLWGVFNAHCIEDHSHLYVVEYDPHFVTGREILNRVQRRGLHAELMGL